MKKIIIFYAIVIHLLFFISALKTHTFDNFFAQGNIHEYQGIDFFQVPNGAYAWLKNGTLTGDLPAGIPAYHFGNRNVYHPFFTIVIGIPLQLFQPRTAFTLWLIFRLCLTSFLLLTMIKKYKNHNNLYLAILFFLGIFPHYLEIWNGQYHFLLDATIFLLLWGALTKKNQLFTGVVYAGSLLIKPIGLLWLPTFFLKKHYQTIAVGLGLALLCSIPFILNQDGLYFFSNLFDRVQAPIGGPPGIFTLDSLLRFFSWSKQYASPIKLISVGLLLVIQWKLKPNFFTSLFLWTSFYLLFYDLVFEYHYTSLAPFLALGVLTQAVFQSKIMKLLSLTYLLPSPFILFYLLQFQAQERNITNIGWVLMVLFRIVPLIIMNLLIIRYLINKRVNKTLLI